MFDYSEFFQEVDELLFKKYDGSPLPFCLIGRTALDLAGLAQRGTKDLDVLAEKLEVSVSSHEKFIEIEKMLKKEFGRGSAGATKHGFYIDLVEKGVPWLPPNPQFIKYKKYRKLEVDRLSPVDVCVSKTFSNFKRAAGRANDKSDIVDAIEERLFDAEAYVRRVDESFSLYEAHAEAPEVFPRVVRFIEEEIIPKYCVDQIRLAYVIPSWMENV